MVYLQVSPLGGSRDETWRGQGIKNRSVSWNLPKLTNLTCATSPSVDILSTCKVGQKLGVPPSVDMLPFGVTIPVTVPQRSEIPEGLMNYPVYT